MLQIVLTQNDTFIIGPVAKYLGILMNAIFEALDFISIPNVGLAIIIFTIVINLLMLPLTIKQQKFSKFSAKMNPELQAIRKKYDGKKDNDSMMAMNQETQAVYAKYGVSATGSCLQLLIQMPILFALYRVIYAMPAYVTKIKDAFMPLVDKLITQEGGVEFIQNFSSSNIFAKQFENALFTSGDTTYVQNTVIDALNRASSSDFSSITSEFPELASQVQTATETLGKYNNFLGLNMADSPSFIITNAFSTGAWFLVIGALMIPLLAALTQWINTKLMPQTATQNGEENSMTSSLKMMNTIMPIMSAVFCFSFPSGMGLYWIAGSVVRSVQQVAVNKHIDKIDIDAMIEKNIEKNNAKRAKMGLPPQTVSNNSKMNTKTVNTNVQSNKKDAVDQYKQVQSKSGNTGSIASKANMVKVYNEKNNK